MRSCGMDTRSMILFLVKIGFTEHAIANVVKANQSTVSRILHGKIRDPRGSIVVAIQNMFEQEIQQRRIPIRYAMN